MFIYNGEPAIIRAFAVCDATTKKPNSRALRRQLYQSESRFYRAAIVGVERDYPIELNRMFAEIPSLSTYSPLWMAHVDKNLIFFSPIDNKAKIDDELPEILGPNFLIRDLHEVRDGLKEVTVIYNEEGSIFMTCESIPKEQLTIHQIVQLLSIGQWSQPLGVEFSFSKPGECHKLYGNVRFEDCISQEFGQNVRLPLRPNLKSGRITDPPDLSELGNVYFIIDRTGRDFGLYDTIFELNGNLVI